MRIACLPHFIPTDELTSHSTRLSKNASQVAGYAALRNKFSSGQPEGYPSLKLRFLAYLIFRALLTTPHGLLWPVVDRRPLVGHLGEI